MTYFFRKCFILTPRRGSLQAKPCPIPTLQTWDQNLCPPRPYRGRVCPPPDPRTWRTSPARTRAWTWATTPRSVTPASVTSPPCDLARLTIYSWFELISIRDLECDCDICLYERNQNFSSWILSRQKMLHFPNGRKYLGNPEIIKKWLIFWQTMQKFRLKNTIYHKLC